MPGEGFLKARYVVAEIAVVVVLRFCAARQAAVVVNPDVAPAQIITVGRPCSRINNVGAVTCVGVKHVLFTAIEVIAVTFLELLALDEVAHDAKVSLVEGVTPAEAQAILCATRVSGLRGVGIKPKTVVLARNHVDYARDRIGAINRRRAVF